MGVNAKCDVAFLLGDVGRGVPVVMHGLARHRRGIEVVVLQQEEHSLVAVVVLGVARRRLLHDAGDGDGLRTVRISISIYTQARERVLSLNCP